MIKRLISLLLVLLCVVGVLTACQRDDVTRIKFRSLVWAVSTPLPKATDFVENLPEGYSVEFAEKYTFSEIKTYTIELILTTPRGKQSRQKVQLRLIVDGEAPTIHGLRDLSVALGRGGVSYLSGVTTHDNCGGAVTLSVNTDAVNLREVGVYPVYYTATDAAGNSTTVRMSLTVYEKEVTEEMLWEALDPVIERIIEDGMTTEQKLKKVYNYVYDNVAYVSTADKSGWVRAAYEGLTMRRGDCYTYFALSKAFFERLGIENVDMQRDPQKAALADERHFWNLVNVGTKNDPRWYHFDACHIKDLPKPWGFLMTDDQLAWYTAEKVSREGVTNYFYAFEEGRYPKTPTQKINTDY